MSKAGLISLAGFYCLAAFASAATAATFDVSVIDNAFSPEEVTIEVGDRVRWTNASGGNQHDVTANDLSFASVTASSFTFSWTFNSVEEVRYHCTVHSFMQGLVSVVAAGTPPTASSVPTISTGGMIALIASIALLGLLVLRRRKEI